MNHNSRSRTETLTTLFRCLNMPGLRMDEVVEAARVAGVPEITQPSPSLEHEYEMLEHEYERLNKLLCEERRKSRDLWQKVHEALLAFN